MAASTDRIQRRILVKAPRSRVWRALANAEEFGEWFRVNLKGQAFVAGERAKGNILHPGYEHIVWDVLVERVEPERCLAFRWHPYAIDPKVDYSHEPTTLVLFELEDAEGGTLLTLTESGFDDIPVERRDTAFRMNGDGWSIQMQNIVAHVAAHPR